MTEHDDERVARMAAEIKAKEASMEIVFHPLTVLQLAGVIQLARRHPDFPASHLDTVDRFLAAVRAYFADCPTVLEVIRQGDDPAFDRPIRRRR